MEVISCLNMGNILYHPNIILRSKGSLQQAQTALVERAVHGKISYALFVCFTICNQSAGKSRPLKRATFVRLERYREIYIVQMHWAISPRQGERIEHEKHPKFEV